MAEAVYDTRTDAAVQQAGGGGGGAGGAGDAGGGGCGGEGEGGPVAFEFHLGSAVQVDSINTRVESAYGFSA